MENDKQAFIVAYNGREAQVRSLLVDREFCEREMLDEFLRAAAIHNLNRDDIVPWNNQFWAIVDANEPKEALEKAIDKLTEYISSRKIHKVEGEE